jgi:hypothetical protein
MEITDVKLRESYEFDDDNRMVRIKKAVFKVNGLEHTLKISLPDFENGKTRALIEREAAKIDAVMTGKK